VWPAASLWSRCVRGRRSGGARLWRRCVRGRGALVADRCESSVRASVSRLCELRPLRCGTPPAALCELRPLRAVPHRFSWLPVWREALCAPLLSGEASSCRPGSGHSSRTVGRSHLCGVSASAVLCQHYRNSWRSAVDWNPEDRPESCLGGAPSWEVRHL